MGETMAEMPMGRGGTTHELFQSLEGEIEKLIEMRAMIEQAIAPAVMQPTDVEKARPEEIPQNELHRLLMRLTGVNEMYRDLYRRIKF